MTEAPTRKWYFSRKEIECQTPSRFDGITYKQEQHLRKLYCSFLQELGIELKVPQVTIATALMFCHRFYMRQSHAKNDWQTIATVCMFLACKAEETPRSLGELLVVAYKLIFKGDASASRRIRERYDKQKELIVIGEQLLLTTIAFDLNIEHPYKPLVAALKRLGITHNELVKVAWNFVNDWLRTSLCLQHKPHYIAAGSLFLAAKVKKVKLASENGKAWWMEFDVSPKQLEDVIQQMMGLVEQSQNQTSQTKEPKDQNVTESRKAEMVTSSGCSIVQDSKMIPPKDVGGPGKSATSSCVKNRAFGNAHNTSSDSSSANSIVENSKMQASMDPFQAAKFVLSNAIKKQDFHKVDVMSKETPKCQTSDTGSGSAVSVVEDGDSGEPFTAKSDLTSSCKIVGNRQVDVNRIREKLKNRNLAKSMKRKHAEDDMDDEAWIERELEDGIVLETSYPEKKLKV